MYYLISYYFICIYNLISYVDNIMYLYFIIVENENHCDFVKLREMLIRTNMEDLRESTHKTHYELYRRNKLQDMGFSESESQR